MGRLEDSVNEPVVSEKEFCAGCKDPLGENYFVSPCGIRYCKEKCYLFYNED